MHTSIPVSLQVEKRRLPTNNKLFTRKKGRFYFIDDKRYVSVTSILDVINKPQLITWAARQAAEIALAELGRSSIERVVSEVFKKKETAADKGTLVHDYIKDINERADFSLGSNVDPNLQGYIKAFMTYRESVNPETLFFEQECFSEEHEYAGTADWVIRLPNKSVWLIDFKTGAIYREAGLQMVAYKVALEEMSRRKLIPELKIDHTAVLQLSSDGTFNQRIFDEPFATFLACKQLWSWCNLA